MFQGIIYHKGNDLFCPTDFGYKKKTVFTHLRFVEQGAIGRTKTFIPNAHRASTKGRLAGA